MKEGEKYPKSCGDRPLILKGSRREKRVPLPLSDGGKIRETALTVRESRGKQIKNIKDKCKLRRGVGY